MPDLERLTDKLMIDMAPTPEDKAWADGYVKGKSRARFEVAAIALVLCVLSLWVISKVEKQQREQNIKDTIVLFGLFGENK